MAKVYPGSTNQRIGNHRMGPAEWGFLFALAFLWSGVFFLTKIALREMRPFTVVVLRLATGAVVLHIAVLAIGSRMPTSLRIWVAFFGMGALNNLIPFCLIARGQTQIASGLAAILNATTPLFTVLLAHLLTHDERMTPSRLGGVLLGVVGVVVMIGPGALNGVTTNVLGRLPSSARRFAMPAPAYSAGGSAGCRRWSPRQAR